MPSFVPNPGRPHKKMTSAFSSVFNRATAYLTPSTSSDSIPRLNGAFSKASQGALFPKVDPAVDGEDCDHDCASCTIQYPSKFKIEEDDKLYGHINGWATHLIVATGKTDWVKDVQDEKGSVMEAVGKCGENPTNGKMMLSASNMPVPENPEHDHSASAPTTVLLLPSFTLIDNVTPSSVPELITQHVNLAPTNTTPLITSTLPRPKDADHHIPPQPSVQPNAVSTPSPDPPVPPTILEPPSLTPSHISSPSALTTRPCPHKYLILLCSQRTRDARCGQSAPLLRREFERHLRPLGLYRDLHDQRPGGVGVYFISHVGGHKYSANVMIYRRHIPPGDTAVVGGGGGAGEGGQCIWLARVRPEDCEGIVKFTVLRGKVVKPDRQLRGGFDREKGLVSW